MSLVVSELYKKYGNKVVVDHLSFEMKEPGVYALLELMEREKPPPSA